MVNHDTTFKNNSRITFYLKILEFIFYRLNNNLKQIFS